LAILAQHIGTSKRPRADGLNAGGGLESSKKAGKYFTFFRFLDLIMKCAKVTFSGYSTG